MQWALYFVSIYISATAYEEKKILTTHCLHLYNFFLLLNFLSTQYWTIGTLIVTCYCRGESVLAFTEKMFRLFVRIPSRCTIVQQNMTRLTLSVRPASTHSDNPLLETVKKPPSRIRAVYVND